MNLSDIYIDFKVNTCNISYDIYYNNNIVVDCFCLIFNEIKHKFGYENCSKFKCNICLFNNPNNLKETLIRINRELK